MMGAMMPPEAISPADVAIGYPCARIIGSKIVDKQGQGFWLNIALGIVGALVGGFLFDLIGSTGVTGLNIWSMIVAIIGSVVVLWIYNAVAGRRAT
jgi:uncharacterized membrane protein YeaQ/YmgE (transglycosylase-associated protein family)